MSLTKAVFSDFEEVGIRLKALRVRGKFNMSNVRTDQMSHIALVRLEEGRGSLDGLVRLASMLNATVDVRLGGDAVELADLRDYIKAHRQRSVTVSEAAKMVGVTHAGVTVFEDSKRPQVVSIGRYVRGLGLDLELTVKDSAGVSVIPADFIKGPELEVLQVLLKEVTVPDVGDKFTDSISAALREVRMSSGLSRRQVAAGADTTESTVVKVESETSRLETFQKVAFALNRELFIVIDGEPVTANEASAALDAVRVSRGVSLSDHARNMGTTYRAVRIFPASAVTSRTFKKYADALGVKVSHRLVKRGKVVRKGNVGVVPLSAVAAA